MDPDKHEKDELEKWAAEKEIELAEEGKVRIRIAVDEPKTAAPVSAPANHAWKVTIPCVIRHGDDSRLLGPPGLKNRLGARNLNITIHAPAPEDALAEIERRLSTITTAEIGSVPRAPGR